MPNWCNNVATLQATKARIDTVVAGAAGDGVLQALIPVPEELRDTISGSFGDADKQAALEAQTAANIEKYGYGNWYDFCVNEWGTKWDLCDVQVNRIDDETVTLSFETAWAPPIEAYEKLLAMGFAIEAFYYEPGMCFVGKWADGFDDCIEFSGYDSKTVRDAIGDELDDMFNVSESMAEWEDENEEDEELYTWVKEGAEAKAE